MAEKLIWTHLNTKIMCQALCQDQTYKLCSDSEQSHTQRSHVLIEHLEMDTAYLSVALIIINMIQIIIIYNAGAFHIAFSIVMLLLWISYGSYNINVERSSDKTCAGWKLGSLCATVAHWENVSMCVSEIVCVYVYIQIYTKNSLPFRYIQPRGDIAHSAHFGAVSLCFVFVVVGVVVVVVEGTKSIKRYTISCMCIYIEHILSMSRDAIMIAIGARSRDVELYRRDDTPTASVLLPFCVGLFCALQILL